MMRICRIKRIILSLLLLLGILAEVTKRVPVFSTPFKCRFALESSSEYASFVDSSELFVVALTLFKFLLGDKKHISTYKFIIQLFSIF